MKNKLQHNEKVCKNKDFCGTVLPFQKDNALKFNQDTKSDETPCIIYTDHEFQAKTIDGFIHNQENLSTIKIGEHIPRRYSMSTIWTFNNIENKLC